MRSECLKQDYFLPGPVRFANHSCRANAKLIIASRYRTGVVAIKGIAVGDEITVDYGDGYFGVDNEECRCTHPMQERRKRRPG